MPEDANIIIPETQNPETQMFSPPNVARGLDVLRVSPLPDPFSLPHLGGDDGDIDDDLNDENQDPDLLPRG